MLTQRCSQPATGRQRSRLTFCPTGVFTHLPIHAAGKNNGVGSSLGDYFVSSYTPTLGALLHVRRKPSSMSLMASKMVLAAATHPPDDRDLPYAGEEVMQVQALVRSAVNVELLHDAEAFGLSSILPTIANIVERLPSAALLHLACHGHQDLNNPLESGFLLRDGRLTVGRLLSLKLDHAFFAFLGACETAKGDRAQPDQAIHLAATMLFAGFRSVIGTMW